MTLAHASLVDPLANESGCGSCHAAGTPELVARYRAEGGAERDAGAGMTGRGTTSGSARPSGATRSPHGDPRPNALLALVIGALGVLGFGFVLRNERRRVAAARRGGAAASAV